MSQKTKFNELWVSDGGHITNTEGGYVGYLEDFSTLEQERIVACVNACRGISQEVLERIADGRGFGDIIEGLLQVKLPDFEGHWTQQFEEPPDAD